MQNRLEYLDHCQHFAAVVVVVALVFVVVEA